MGRLFESSGISGEVTLLLLKCSLSPASWWEEEKSQSSGREDKQVGFKIAFSCTRISTNDELVKFMLNFSRCANRSFNNYGINNCTVLY